MTQANGKESAIFGRGRTITIPGVGILFDWGITVPTDGAEGYAPGCLFQDVDGSADANFYINQGTKASSNFDPIDIGTILASNVPILDTAAWFTATNTETVLAELGELLLANSSAADDGGPSPLIWSGAPILDVMLDQSKGFYFFTDFMEGDVTSGASIWTTTNRTSGTIVYGTEQGGTVIIDPAAATAAQGITCQLAAIGIKPEPGTTIRMEWRMKIDEDDGRLAFGLGAVGTTNWAATDTIVVNADCAMFFRDAGTGVTDWSVQICDGSTVQAVDDLFTGSDAGYETFGLVIVGDGADSGDSITWYHNGVTAAFTTDVSDMPDAIMVPTFESNADGTDQPVVVMDWLKILVTNATDGSRA